MIFITNNIYIFLSFPYNIYYLIKVVFTIHKILRKITFISILTFIFSICLISIDISINADSFQIHHSINAYAKTKTKSSGKYSGSSKKSNTSGKSSSSKKSSTDGSSTKKSTDETANDSNYSQNNNTYNSYNNNAYSYNRSYGSFLRRGFFFGRGNRFFYRPFYFGSMASSIINIISFIAIIAVIIFIMRFFNRRKF